LVSDRMVTVIKEGKMLNSSLFFNVFKDIAFHVYSGLLLFNISLIKIGICDVYLAGSGPTLFSVFQNKEKAEEFFTRCKNQGMKVYLAATL
jgi:4-diphosphocytidyl-2-C-methyl-D-erythritol kinase